MSGQLGVGISLSSQQAPAGRGVRLGDQLTDGSWFRVAGDETLSPGRRFIFRLQSSVALATGQAGSGERLWNQQSYIGGVVDGVGQWTVGRQFHAGVDRISGSLDVFEVSGSSATVTPLSLVGTNRLAGNAARADRMFKLQWQGWPAWTIAVSAAAPSGIANRSESAAIGYAGSGCELGFAWLHYRAAPGEPPAQQRFLGGGGNCAVGATNIYGALYHNHIDASTPGAYARKQYVAHAGTRTRFSVRTSVLLGYYYDIARQFRDGETGKKSTILLSAEEMLSSRARLSLTFTSNRLLGAYRSDVSNIGELGLAHGAHHTESVSLGWSQRF